MIYIVDAHSIRMPLFYSFSISFLPQLLVPLGNSPFTGVNYFRDSKSVTGGGISCLRTLKLSAKWRPGARVSIYTLQYISQLFLQIRLAEGMGDRNECFQMNYCIWKCFVKCQGLQDCMVLLSLLTALTLSFSFYRLGN